MSWLKQQCRFFGDEPVEDFIVSRIQDYLNSPQGNMTETINKKVTFLRKILASAHEDDLIAKKQQIVYISIWAVKTALASKSFYVRRSKNSSEKSRLLTTCT